MRPRPTQCFSACLGRRIHWLQLPRFPRPYRGDVNDPAVRLKHPPLDELLNNQHRSRNIRSRTLRNLLCRNFPNDIRTSVPSIIHKYIHFAIEVLSNGVADCLRAGHGEGVCLDGYDFGDLVVC